MGYFVRMKDVEIWLNSLDTLRDRYQLTDIWIQAFDSFTGFNSKGAVNLSHESLIRFDKADTLSAWIRQICFNRKIRIDARQPYASGRFSHGRFTCLLDNICADGDQLFIRFNNHHEKIFFQDDKNKLEKFEANFSKFHWLICGPSGSGKSSFLKKIIDSHYQAERIVVFERFKELHLDCPYVTHLTELQNEVSGVQGTSMEELVDIGFRLNSTKFVVGEIRNREFRNFVQLALSGHGQVLATFHCDSFCSLIKRLQLIDYQGYERLKDKLGAVFLKRKQNIFLVDKVVTPK